MVKRYCKTFFLILFVTCLLRLSPTVYGYTKGDAFHLDLSNRIRSEECREYVQKMLDYYIRTDRTVQSALDGGFSAVFLFDGCSDHMRELEFRDISYYRLTGICIAVKQDDQGKLKLSYYNDHCSTIPDRPLEYGAWSLPDVGKVGPATVCDGTYQLYSVLHKGQYEALNVRTEYRDPLADAVYMLPDGFTASRASEINVHTRTTNHISSRGMWSAGCPLVGGGQNWEFRMLMKSVYYTQYPTFETGNFVGSLTIDRQCLRHELYTLYRNPDAVDSFLTVSRKIQPNSYLEQCTITESFEEAVEFRSTTESALMTLPCTNAVDARSVESFCIPKGQSLLVDSVIENPTGEKWLCLNWEGERCYLASSCATRTTEVNKLLDILF